MKNLLLLLLVYISIFHVSFPAKAASYGSAYKYVDKGFVYSGIKYPIDTSRAVNFFSPNDYIVPVSARAKSNQVSLQFLKTGKSHTINVMKLFQWGDAGIYQAALNGKITKIHYIETKRKKLFIPNTKLPIYVSKNETIVYGE